MAKNFPFFKFVATEWLTGDIVFEDFESQGIFINICALYWHRDGKLTIDEIVKRLKTDKINALKDNFFKVRTDGFIEIKFLDEQLIDANHVSKVNSVNGKKGAEAKRKKAKAKQPLSDGSAKSSKEEQEEEQEEEEPKKKDIPTLDDFLNYGLSKNPKIKESLKLKYEAWVVNDWKDGNGKEIKNWKLSLLNTIPYLKENEPPKPKTSSGLQFGMM